MNDSPVGILEIPCVGGVLLDTDGRILLVRRAHAPAQGLWSIPGGRVEQGEEPEAAVVRELREETGLRARVDRFVGEVRREAPSGGVYLIRDYLMTVEGDPTPVAGDDALEAAWFSTAELADLPTSPGLVDALTQWGLLPAGP